MVEPLYPFGHGLSYSHFEISNERAIGEQSPVEIIYPDGKVDNKKMPVFTDSIKIAVDGSIRDRKNSLKVWKLFSSISVIRMHPSQSL